MTALVLGATVATRWFSARRGLAVGLLTASNATGQLVFLPLLAAVTQQWGWRAALALVVCLLVVGARLRAGADARPAVRRRPGAVRRTRDRPGAEPRPRTSRPARLSPLVALREASGSRVFWILAATFFVCGPQHQRPHPDALDHPVRRLRRGAGRRRRHPGGDRRVRLRGHDPVGLALRPLRQPLAAVLLLRPARPVADLSARIPTFSVVSLSLFGVFYGLDWVATVPPTVRLSADAFGAERANVTFGWIFAAHQIGAACAAFGAGVARTNFSSYLPALYVAGAACLVASALVVTLAPPRRRRAALA